MDRNKWLKHYKSNKQAIWINVRLTNGQEFYNDKFEGWLDVVNRCNEEDLFVEELALQFRSHEVKIDLTDAEGLYIVRCVMGQFGSKTSQYIITGILKKDIVYKEWWLVPELVANKHTEDPVKDCFEEALIYAKKN